MHIARLTVPLALIMAAAPVTAQERAERPYRGLFGAGLGEAEHSIVASGSLGGGWDNNVLADASSAGGGGNPNANSGISGGVGQASGSVRYNLEQERFSIGASGAMSAHYYPSLNSRVRGSVCA